MILFFLFFIITIAGGIVCRISDREDVSLIWAISFFITGLCGIAFIVTAGATIVTHNDWITEQAKINYIEKHNAIMWAVENRSDNVVSLTSEIASYNKDVRLGRIQNSSWWTNWTTYDFYDELELIELK